MIINIFGPTEAEIEEKARAKIEEKLEQVKNMLQNDIMNSFLNSNQKLELMLKLFAEYQKTIVIMKESELERLTDLKNVNESLDEINRKLEENNIKRIEIAPNNTSDFYIEELGYRIHSSMIEKFKQNENVFRNPEYLDQYKDELEHKKRTFERLKKDNNGDVSKYSLIMLYPFDLLKLDPSIIDLMYECLKKESKFCGLKYRDKESENLLNKKKLTIKEFEYGLEKTYERLFNDDIELYNSVKKIELSFLPFDNQTENAIRNYDFELFLLNYIKLNLSKYFDYNYVCLKPMLSQKYSQKEREKIKQKEREMFNKAKENKQD